MKYSKLLVLVVCCSLFVFQSCKEEQINITQNTTEDLRGTIVEVETLKSYSLAQVDSVIDIIGISNIIDVAYPVDLVKVTYRTVNFNGIMEYATGALAVPKLGQDDPQTPFATYCHGTVLEERNIPSALGFESVIGIIFASEGIAVPMPDYLGFGPSPGIHGYVIAKTEASATIDMMRAAMNYFENNEIPYKNEHYVFGYSQGGHAAMATVKAIEEMEESDINLKAAAPMSGPYDLSGAQSITFTEDVEYGAPYYLPYLLLAYNETYQLYENYSDFLVSPFDELLPPLFDGFHTPQEINAVMTDTSISNLPNFPNKIIKPEVLASFKNNPDDKFRKALEENDLHDWAPKTDLNMYYCIGDELVLAQNSITAYNNFIANGATGDIKRFDLGGWTHGECAQFSLIQARAWFLELSE